MTWTTKDSGERETYETGARRDVRTDKGRYDLLPPFAMRRVAGVYERGAAKYGDRNYEKGIPLTRYLDSALRHTFQVLEGNLDEDHAAQAAWNLLAFIQTQEMINRDLLPTSLNDLPEYKANWNTTPVENDGDRWGTEGNPSRVWGVRVSASTDNPDNDKVTLQWDANGLFWVIPERRLYEPAGSEAGAEVPAVDLTDRPSEVSTQDHDIANCTWCTPSLRNPWKPR